MHVRISVRVCVCMRYGKVRVRNNCDGLAGGGIGGLTEKRGGCAVGFEDS